MSMVGHCKHCGAPIWHYHRHDCRRHRDHGVPRIDLCHLLPVLPVEECRRDRGFSFGEIIDQGFRLMARGEDAE